MLDSDWSRQFLLRSDWSVPKGAMYTTLDNKFYAMILVLLVLEMESLSKRTAPRQTSHLHNKIFPELYRIVFLCETGFSTSSSSVCVWQIMHNLKVISVLRGNSRAILATFSVSKDGRPLF